MNARTARQVLRGYRPSGEDDDEREVSTAVKVASKTPQLEADFRNQLAFDQALAAKLETPLPEDLSVSLEEVARRLEGKPSRRFTLRDPVMLAVGLAFVLLVGLLAWVVTGKGNAFAGMEEAMELARQGDKADPDQFQEIDTKASALTDWFVAQQFDGFVVPPGLESAPVIGARTFKYDDMPVAVAAVSKPKSLWYVFEANQLGISLHPGEWKVVEYGQTTKRAMAVTQVGTMAVVIALRVGGKAEMQKYIESLPHAP